MDRTLLLDDGLELSFTNKRKIAKEKTRGPKISFNSSTKSRKLLVPLLLEHESNLRQLSYSTTNEIDGCSPSRGGIKSTADLQLEDESNQRWRSSRMVNQIICGSLPLARIKSSVALFLDEESYHRWPFVSKTNHIRDSNGVQAWKVLEDLNNHIDIVLTEVLMPYLSYLEGVRSTFCSSYTRFVDSSQASGSVGEVDALNYIPL
ncbi:hypothetical protein YC2023_041475 [Brassica napus]